MVIFPPLSIINSRSHDTKKKVSLGWHLCINNYQSLRFIKREICFLKCLSKALFHDQLPNKYTKDFFGGGGNESSLHLKSILAVTKSPLIIPLRTPGNCSHLYVTNHNLVFFLFLSFTFSPLIFLGGLISTSNHWGKLRILGHQVFLSFL